MGYNDLEYVLSSTSQILLKEIEQHRDIFILSNSTVDGIISSAILLTSIYNTKGSAIVRCVYQTTLQNLKKAIKEAIDEKHDFYIFTDFESEFFEFISGLLIDSNFLFINTDPNIVEKSVVGKEKTGTFLNPWVHNEDSKKESALTTSSLLYFMVKNFDRKIITTSSLPIVAIVSRNLCEFYDNEMVGINNEILQTAIDLNLIEIRKELSFGERETASIIDVLENNTIHYIKEITWNKAASCEIIKNADVQYTLNGKIKALNEFSEEDSEKILSSIEKFLDEKTSVKYKSDNNIKERKKRNRNQLFSYNYILTTEERDSILKNARSFSKALDSCIKSKKYGLALSICLGDRSDIMTEVKIQVSEYNDLIKNLSLKIFGEKWRFYDDKETIFINGEGVLDEKNIDLFISFLNNSISFSDRLICLRIMAMDNDGVYKFSLIKTRYSKIDFHNIKNKIKNLVKNNKDSDSLTNNSAHILTSTDNRMEIMVSAIDLEGFLSNIKKIVLDAKIS